MNCGIFGMNNCFLFGQWEGNQITFICGQKKMHQRCSILTPKMHNKNYNSMSERKMLIFFHPEIIYNKWLLKLVNWFKKWFHSNVELWLMVKVPYARKVLCKFVLESIGSVGWRGHYYYSRPAPGGPR